MILRPLILCAVLIVPGLARAATLDPEGCEPREHASIGQAGQALTMFHEIDKRLGEWDDVYNEVWKHAVKDEDLSAEQRAAAAGDPRALLKLPRFGIDSDWRVLRLKMVRAPRGGELEAAVREAIEAARYLLASPFRGSPSAIEAHAALRKHAEQTLACGLYHNQFLLFLIDMKTTEIGEADRRFLAVLYTGPAHPDGPKLPWKTHYFFALESETNF